MLQWVRHDGVEFEQVGQGQSADASSSTTDVGVDGIVAILSRGGFIVLFPLEAFTPLTGGLNAWRRTVDAIRATILNLSALGRRHVLHLAQWLEQTGIVFERGVHETAAGQVAINRLSVHNDGVVVRSNRTEHAEAFFNDVTSWLIEEHECRQVQQKPLYVSEIVVDFEAPVANMINNSKEIVNLLLSHVDKRREVKAAAFSALSFEFATKDSMAAAKFLIERRVGTTVDDERYFCSAPLTTERHLEVLQEIERLFS